MNDNWKCLVLKQVVTNYINERCICRRKMEGMRNLVLLLQLLLWTEGEHHVAQIPGVFLHHFTCPACGCHFCYDCCTTSCHCPLESEEMALTKWTKWYSLWFILLLFFGWNRTSHRFPSSPRNVLLLHLYVSLCFGPEALKCMCIEKQDSLHSIWLLHKCLTIRMIRSSLGPILWESSWLKGSLSPWPWDY